MKITKTEIFLSYEPVAQDVWSIPRYQFAEQ